MRSERRPPRGPLTSVQLGLLKQYVVHWTDPKLGENFAWLWELYDTAVEEQKRRQDLEFDLAKANDVPYGCMTCGGRKFNLNGWCENGCNVDDS